MRFCTDFVPHVKANGYNSLKLRRCIAIIMIDMESFIITLTFTLAENK